MNSLRRRLVAIALAVAAILLAPALPVQGQAALEQFEGTLLVVWGDPHPILGSGGEIRYSLAMPDGRVFPLQVAGQTNLSAADFGRRVVVSGRRTAGGASAAAAQAPEVIEAVSIARSQTSQDEPIGQAVLGTRKVIFLAVKFSDDIAVPHPPAFFTDLNNPATPPIGALFPTTINGFFAKTSWSQFGWQGDVGGAGGVGAPGGWLTLPHPKSYYANCGWSSSCANLNALSADAIALAKAEGISFPVYDNINFVLSNDLDCCAWGGNYSFDGKSYGATWEPPWGQEAGTYVHEMGHSVGLPHSGWVYYAYDSPWDMMSARRSANSTLCGSYSSANDNYSARNLICTEPGDGYIAPHKDALGWFPAPNVVVTDTFSTGSWTVEGGALPLGAAVKMIKICLPGFSCTGGSARYFTVEARVKSLGGTSQYDNAIPGEGIIIHDVRMGRPAISGSCYFNSQSGWAVPIDATPGDYNSSTCSFAGLTALYNAQWVPGQTYTNSAYGVTITVISRSGSTFVVSVAPAPLDPPASFNKTSPANGATSQANSLSLSWGSAPGATSYEYCHDTTNDDACGSWTNSGTNTFATISNLGGSTTHYWQARAVNSGGATYANNGAFWSFTTLASPGSFSKASPGAGATGVSTSPTLSWGASTSATSYQYCIDSSNDNACSAWTSTGASTSVNLNGLGASTTYYWHVRASNGLGTAYANGSSVAFWSFTTAGVPPGAFSKSSPANGASGQLVSLSLGWGSSSGATSYEYCYDTTSNGACDTAWTSAGANLTAALTGLTPGTTYSWQVRAQNTSGPTVADGGAWWSFTTQVFVTVTTSPIGRSISVDGTAYVSPQTFGWPVGSQHVIATSTPQLSTGARHVFSGWSDSGPLSHTVTTPSVATTYTASFAAEYVLTTIISSGGGTLGASPSSPDGFYASGTPVQLTATPDTGFIFSSWSGDLTGAANPGTLTLDGPRSVTATFSSNLIRNGDFSRADQWTPFATPDPSYVVSMIVAPMLDGPQASGVLAFYRRPPPPGTTNEAGVFQETGAALPAQAPLRAQFSVANGTGLRKRISVALADHDFSDVAVCTFWLPPQSPFRTYQMRTHTTQAWSNASIYFYAETPGIDGFYALDSVSLEYDAGVSTVRTDCVDPTAPAPPGGPDGPTLLTNGDFEAGLSPWTATGSMTSQIASGVFEFLRPAGTPAGVVEQDTAQAIPAQEILTAQLQLGNSSTVRKRVTVQVRDSDSSDLLACTFWLAPTQPLSSYAVRGFASKAWTSTTLSVYPETVGTEEWIRLDGVTLQRTPSAAILGTECLEPGALPMPGMGVESQGSVARSRTSSVAPSASATIPLRGGGADPLSLVKPRLQVTPREPAPAGNRLAVGPPGPLRPAGVVQGRPAS